MGFIERIQAKIEIFRLEQRYTRRRHRRSTFVSNAVYVDGEYIYNTPAATGSSTNSASTTSSNNTRASHAFPPTSTTTTTVTAAPAAGSAYTTDDVPSRDVTEKAGKKLNRYSSMPGFGSLSKAGSRNAVVDWRTASPTISEVR